MTNLAGLDLERLGRRSHFLESRAVAHLKFGGDSASGKAYAATLYRDAACVSILLGNVQDARNFLRKSGQLLLDIGILSGAALIILAGINVSEELAQYDDVFTLFGATLKGEVVPPGERRRRPMLEAATSSPRQLLSLIQADVLSQSQIPGLVPNRIELMQRLNSYGGFPAGTTGISIASYLDLARWFSEMRPSEGFDFPRAMPASFAALTAGREEHIRIAMRDAYHWKLALRPAELIDLDVAILCAVSFRRGMPYEWMRARFDPELPLMDAPVEAAFKLVGSRPRSRLV